MPRRRSKILTPNQKKVLKFIQEHILRYGIPPTYREILEYMGARSIGTVQRYIRTLEEKGYISRDEGKHRGIIINRPPIVLEGVVSAGGGVNDAIKAPTDVMKRLFGETPPTAAYTVEGDSMKDVGIMEGDIVLIKEIDNPQHGDIVVAYRKSDDTMLVKRVIRGKDGRHYLRSENTEGRKQNPEKYGDIPIDDDIQIIGKVTAVIRTLL